MAHRPNSQPPAKISISRLLLEIFVIFCISISLVGIILAALGKLPASVGAAATGLVALISTVGTYLQIILQHETANKHFTRILQRTKPKVGIYFLLFTGMTTLLLITCLVVLPSLINSDLTLTSIPPNPTSQPIPTSPPTVSQITVVPTNSPVTSTETPVTSTATSTPVTTVHIRPEIPSCNDSKGVKTTWKLTAQQPYCIPPNPLTSPSLSLNGEADLTQIDGKPYQLKAFITYVQIHFTKSKDTSNWASLVIQLQLSPGRVSNYIFMVNSAGQWMWQLTASREKAPQPIPGQTTPAQDMKIGMKFQNKQLCPTINSHVQCIVTYGVPSSNTQTPLLNLIELKGISSPVFFSAFTLDSL